MRKRQGTGTALGVWIAIVALFLSGCGMSEESKPAARSATSVQEARYDTLEVVIGGEKVQVRVRKHEYDFNLQQPFLRDTIETFVGSFEGFALPANPASGFRWEVAAVDTSVLEYVGRKYTPFPTPAGFPGVGGTSLLVIRARKTGQSEVQLNYSATDKPHFILRAKVYVARSM